jgi:hypothetical protein
MVRDGYITLAQAAEAAKEPLVMAEFDPAKESAGALLHRLCEPND